MCHPPASGARGHRFESCRARRRKPRKLRGFAFLRTRYSWRAAIFAARPNGGQKLPRFCGRAEASTRLADGPVEGRTVLLALADEVTVDAGRRGLVVASHGRRIRSAEFPEAHDVSDAGPRACGSGVPAVLLHRSACDTNSLGASRKPKCSFLGSVARVRTDSPPGDSRMLRSPVRLPPSVALPPCGWTGSATADGTPGRPAPINPYAEAWAGNRAARDTLIKVRQGHFLGAH
jgi:hypothetical protein